MGRRKTTFKAPVLKDRRGDLSKDWYIEIQFRDPRSDQLVRRRFSDGLNFMTGTDAETIIARNKKANEIIEGLNAKLKAGWTPFSDTEFEFVDNLEYHATAQIYGRMKASKRNLAFVESLFLELKKPEFKPKTYGSYQSKLRKLANWCKLNKLDEIDICFITEKHIQQFFIYLCEKGLDKRTVKKYKQTVNTFFKFAINRGFLKVNPLTEVMIPEKKVDAASRPIIQSDLETLLREIERKDPQLYLACLFQYYTAIRPGTELRLLKISDLDLYKGSATINDISAKRERHETVDMPKQLQKICVERYLLHTFPHDYYVFGRLRTPGPDAMGMNTMRERFNKYRDALNLPKHYKYYSFKHTGAGRLLESGATLVEVQSHLRHKDISDTQAYVIRHFGQRNKKVLDHFPDPYQQEKTPINT